MENRTKKDIAAAEGISPSAVSQRAGRDGLDLIVRGVGVPAERAVSALAVMLIAMGIADAVRRLTRPVWVPAVVAPAVVVVCAALSGLWHRGDLALLAIAAAAGVGWVLLGARAERSGDHEGAPLAVFGLALAALILLSGWASDVGGLVQRWTRGSTFPASATSARTGC